MFLIFFIIFLVTSEVLPPIVGFRLILLGFIYWGYIIYWPQIIIAGFLNYYDASSEGLRLASKRLRFGAPSGGCKNTYNPDNFCWLLLDHLNNGTNYFSGCDNVRVDFLSIHEKVKNCGLTLLSSSCFMFRGIRHKFTFYQANSKHNYKIPSMNVDHF